MLKCEVQITEFCGPSLPEPNSEKAPSVTHNQHLKAVRNGIEP
jgi:hypothetical protein